MPIIDEIDDTVALRERKTTRQGVTIIRGGQTITDSLLSAVQNSYTNIVYHPVAMTFLIIGVMLVISEHHGTKGPLEVILDFLKTKAEDKDEPEFLKKVISYLVTMFTHIVTYKDKYSALIFVAIAPIAKPSSRNFVMATIISLFLLLSKYSLLEMLLISQCFYLHVMLRNPSYKFLMIIACAAILFFDDIFTPAETPPEPPVTTTTPPPVPVTAAPNPRFAPVTKTGK